MDVCNSQSLGQGGVHMLRCLGCCDDLRVKFSRTGEDGYTVHVKIVISLKFELILKKLEHVYCLHFFGLKLNQN